jgi:hypothetical protein
MQGTRASQSPGLPLGETVTVCLMPHRCLARSISMIRNLEMHDPVLPPALLWREDQKRNFIGLIDSFWSEKTILIEIG